MSSSTGCPGLSFWISSCVWYGRYSVDSFLSSLRCEARSQPCATGVCGSIAPMNVTSRRSGVKTRSTRNRSASSVLDETLSLHAIGPVISISFSSGSEMKVTPSPIASKVIEELEFCLPKRSWWLLFRHRRVHCAVSYTHLRAHETPEHLVCRLLL